MELPLLAPGLSPSGRAGEDPGSPPLLPHGALTVPPLSLPSQVPFPVTAVVFRVLSVCLCQAGAER